MQAVRCCRQQESRGPLFLDNPSLHFVHGLVPNALFAEKRPQQVCSVPFLQPSRLLNDQQAVFQRELAPRILAAGISALVLWVWFCWLTVLGGTMLAWLTQDVSPTEMLVRLVSGTELHNLWTGACASLMTGMMLAAVVVQTGLTTHELDDLPLTARRALARGIAVIAVAWSLLLLGALR